MPRYFLRLHRSFWMTSSDLNQWIGITNTHGYSVGNPCNAVVVTPPADGVAVRVAARLVSTWQIGVGALIARLMGPTWAHLGPSGPRWAPCWPHELCYLGGFKPTGDPLTNMDQLYNQHGKVITFPIKCCIKLLIHSQTSTARRSRSVHLTRSKH